MTNEFKSIGKIPAAASGKDILFNPAHSKLMIESPALADLIKRIKGQTYEVGTRKNTILSLPVEGVSKYLEDHIHDGNPAVVDEVFMFISEEVKQYILPEKTLNGIADYQELIEGLKQEKNPDPDEIKDYEESLKINVDMLIECLKVVPAQLLALQRLINSPGLGKVIQEYGKRYAHEVRNDNKGRQTDETYPQHLARMLTTIKDNVEPQLKLVDKFLNRKVEDFPEEVVAAFKQAQMKAKQRSNN